MLWLLARRGLAMAQAGGMPPPAALPEARERDAREAGEGAVPLERDDVGPA